MDRSNHSASSAASSGGEESVDGDSQQGLEGAEGGAVSFTQFKRKLALVPVIFFLLRLPGNILCIWLYLEPTANTESGLCIFFQIAQVFCDPLQGFINGMLFVACSQKAPLKGTDSSLRGESQDSAAIRGKRAKRFADVPAPRNEDSVTDYWSRPSAYGQSGDYHVMPNGQIDTDESRRTSNMYRTRIDED